MVEILGDRYVLGSELGEGGMAQVFRGTMRGVDSAVAVKLLRREVSEDHPEIAQAFLRNRRLLTSVSHTNLVKIIDVVEDGDALGIVMELIEGESLRDYLLRIGQLPPNTALPLFKQIMLGLSELHASGITHGDIKPDNILLDNSTESPVVKVADFGLANVQRRTLPESVIFGTPAYMAPEVISRTVGSAADIYSAGIVLYEMMAGHVPFTGASLEELFYKQQHTEPPPIAELVGDHSGAETLLRRLLAKDPRKRPSAFATLAELEKTPSGVLKHDPEFIAAFLPAPALGRMESTPIRSLRSTILDFRREESISGIFETDILPSAPVSLLSVRDRARKHLTSLRPRKRLQEEEIEHADGKLYRFNLGFDEFLLVDRIDGNGTLNWTTDITPSDFTTLIEEYLENDGTGEERVTICLNGIIDEMGALIGIRLASMGGASFDRDCEFVRFDRDSLTLAYQVLPNSGANGRTLVFGISAPRLTLERVLPLLIMTGTDEIVAHTLSVRADALPPRLAAVMAAEERPRLRVQKRQRTRVHPILDTRDEESSTPPDDSRG